MGSAATNSPGATCQGEGCRNRPGGSLIRTLENRDGRGFFVGESWFCSRRCLERHMSEEFASFFFPSREGAVLSRPKLGTILLARGWLSQEQLQTALSQQDGKRLGTCLRRLGFVTEERLMLALSEHLRLPWVGEVSRAPEINALDALPGTICRRFHLFPLALRGRQGLIMLADCSYTEDLTRGLHQVVDYTLKPLLAPEAVISELMRTYSDSFRSDRVEEVPPGEWSPRTVARLFLDHWFELGAVRARFGLVHDLFWIRYQGESEPSDVLLISQEQAEPG